MKPTDVKWQILDELEAVESTVRTLRATVKKSVPRSPRQRRLNAALQRIEDGILLAEKELEKH